MAHLTEFETKHVIFGGVLDGMDLLKVMELEGSGDGTTARPIVVVDSGELDAQLVPLPLPANVAAAQTASTAPAAGAPSPENASELQPVAPPPSEQSRRQHRVRP